MAYRIQIERKAQKFLSKLEAGRFITEDPIKDGSNWYAYAVNNPLIFTDPDGLEIKRYDTSRTMGDPEWRNVPL